MRRRGAFSALVFILLFGNAHAADPAGNPVLAVTGKVKHPGQFDLNQLAGLPSQEVQVSFETDHGARQDRYKGVLLWTLLDTAGGLDDSEKGAALRHVIKVTAKDGYLVVLSSGEIAPDFGGKPAMIAYQRNDEAPGAGGFRLVMPGDKHGGRYVRDVVAIDVE